jgi:beta-glucosidase
MISTLIVLAASLAAAQEQAPLYKDSAAPVEARVTDLLGRMTLDEEIALLSSDDLVLAGNARLGIPPLKMNDGPVGVRMEDAVKKGETATAFPAGIALGAAFDVDLIGRVAGALGLETLALGRDMLLGPCINIARSPLGGRDFESYGEDPYLAGRLAAAYVSGLQSKKAIACTKHYALNNEEIDRMTVDVKADERTMHEIYLPAFQAAVRAGTWTVMAAYNKINGHYASENAYLLDETLKKRWDFQGFVVSDWGATHSTVEAANAGLDLEAPDKLYFGGGKLQEAVRSGKVPAAAIDDKVRRILRVMFEAGLFERKDSDRPPRSVVDGPESRALALKAAQEGIVLLKNGGLLPLGEKVKTVALIGPSAATARSGGGGSSRVEPAHAVSPLEGLTERAGGKLRIVSAVGVPMPGGDFKTLDPSWLLPPAGRAEKAGLLGEYFGNKELKGEPAFARVDPAVDFEWDTGKADPRLAPLASTNFSVRWTGRLRVPKTGAYELATRSDDGARLWIDGKLVVDGWVDQPPTVHSAPAALAAGRDHDVRLEYYQAGGGASITLGRIEQALAAGLQKEAVAAARKADAALIFVGVSDAIESEGVDRLSLSLPAGQDELIEAVAKVNKNVVVVVQAGTPVLMPWLDRVNAVVEAWYPGEEGGRAIADVLLGTVNPSGRLPVTFPARWEDSPAYGNFPGKDGVVNYAEGLLVGYRHFDTKKIAPLFPFGYGLSYTTFAFGGLKIEAADASSVSPDVAVSLDVKNAGTRAGAEVVQLYVRDESSAVARPYQELKGFARVELGAGESKRVEFRLRRDAFAHYDAGVHDWVLPPGRFTVAAGASSRELPLSGAVELH